MATVTKDELITELAEIGLVGCVKEGYLDNLFADLAPGDPASPETLARLVAVEQKQQTNVVKIGDIEYATQQLNGQFLSLQDIGARQEAAIAELNRSTQVMQEAIAENLETHEVFNTRLDALESAEDNALVKVDALEPRVGLLEQSAISQNNRLNQVDDLVRGNAPGGLKELGGKIDLKADLVGGKIPLNQLPELPTGRKVTVSNPAARLALPVHADITVAYQQDNGVAYILGAGVDPSVAGNWQPLTNTQQSGVTSFNSRSGVVQPMLGDYTTDMVTPTSTRQYVTNTDRTRWDDKIGASQLTEATSAERVISDGKYLTKVAGNEYVLKTDRGTANGIATLGSDGKVPTSQLPPLGLTAAQQTKLSEVENIARLADQRGLGLEVNLLAVDRRLTQVSTDANARIDAVVAVNGSQTTRITSLESKDAAQDARIQALEDASAGGGIPVAEKGAANGVVPLDANSKIEAKYLPTVTPAKRTWKDVKAQRTVGNWFKNETGSDMIVYCGMTTTTSPTREINMMVREIGGATNFTFRSGYVGASVDHTSTIQIVVPSGSEYQMVNNGGSSIANTEFWYEMS